MILSSRLTFIVILAVQTSTPLAAPLAPPVLSNQVFSRDVAVASLGPPRAPDSQSPQVSDTMAGDVTRKLDTRELRTFKNSPRDADSGPMMLRNRDIDEPRLHFKEVNDRKPHDVSVSISIRHDYVGGLGRRNEDTPTPEQCRRNLEEARNHLDACKDELFIARTSLSIIAGMTSFRLYSAYCDYQVASILLTAAREAFPNHYCVASIAAYSTLNCTLEFCKDANSAFCCIRDSVTKAKDIAGLLRQRKDLAEKINHLEKCLVHSD